MKTECETEKMQFQASSPRKVEGHFDGGYLSSDGGVILLGEVEEKLDIVGRFLGALVTIEILLGWNILWKR